MAPEPVVVAPAIKRPGDDAVVLSGKAHDCQIAAEAAALAEQRRIIGYCPLGVEDMEVQVDANQKKY